MGTAVASVGLMPLVCPHCGGPVPLADTDEVACPYCTQAVPMPENLRALRHSLALLTNERRAAERRYRRIGEAPPRILRAFCFFDSIFFWMFGAGFWLCLAIATFTRTVPLVSEHLPRVNANDVMTNSHNVALSLGGTFSTIVLGLLLAGWSRKRVIEVGAPCA